MRSPAISRRRHISLSFSEWLYVVIFVCMSLCLCHLLCWRHFIVCRFIGPCGVIEHASDCFRSVYNTCYAEVAVKRRSVSYYEFSVILTTYDNITCRYVYDQFKYSNDYYKNHKQYNYDRYTY